MEKKRVYRKPVMESETFVPSAYCAICFKIACEAMGDDRFDSRCEHKLDACGTADHQAIRENSNGNLSMWENSADQGWLTCDVVSPNPFTWENIQKNGNQVIWKTYAKNGDGRVWTHFGHAYRKSTSTSNAS